MPYPGVPSDKTDEMERCVKNLMSQGKDKSSAIAICHASIVGNKKKTKKSESTKGGDKTMKDKKIEKKDEIKKDDEVKTEAAPAEAAPAEVKEEQPEKVAEPVAEQPEAKVEDEKKEEPKAEEPKAEESVEEKKEEVKEEAPAEVKVEEEKKEEAPAEKPEEVKPEEPAKEVGEKLPRLTNERLAKIESLLEKAADLITKMAEVKKVQDQAPAEDAPVVNEETLEPKAEEAKEEAKAEEVKPEVTPEPAKSDTSSGGASEAEATVTKALEDFKKDILGRLEKLESMPAPSKAKVFSKNFGGEENVNDEQELSKVEKRLEEIDKLRKDSPHLYTNELIDEAFKLIEKKKTLKGE
jgi:hypothetical protein